MIEAIALVMPKVLNSELRKWINAKALASGVAIKWVDISVDTSGYCAAIKNYHNVIAWNCRVPQNWMQLYGQNVLYVENSLICQSAGIFVDRAGFFSHSNLCTQQRWKNNYRYSLEWVSNRWFGWTYGFRGIDNGPILVALQNRNDCNLNTEFPYGNSAADKVTETLRLLKHHLPDIPTLIRPHPSERKNFNHGGIWRPNWVLDVTESFAERLPQCSALVTVNSTCASEATLSGLPVAVLGTGAFTGSGAVHECHTDITQLAYLFNTPNMDARKSYASAVLSHHFLPYDLTGERVCCEFDDWLNLCL